MGFRWRAMLAVSIVVLVSLSAAHFHADDALIYARYVRNALAGNGLVFNVGERVNALTSPLHTVLLLSLSWLLRGRILLAEWMLGVLFLSATCVLAERYVRYAGVILGGMLYFEIFLGMETPLFIFLLLLTAIAYVQGRWNWLPLLVALTLLTRFEGGAIAVPIAWQMYRQRRWPRWTAWLPAIALVALYLAMNHHFYGRWLPSSGMAKLQQGLSGYWGKWPKAFYHLPYAFWHPLRSLVYTVPLVLWLAWRGAHRSAFKRWNEVVLPAMAIMLAFYTLLNVPGYLWYYGPFIMFAIVYAAHGLLSSERKPVRWAQALMVIAIVHASLMGSFLLYNLPKMYAKYRYISAYLNQNAAPGATVAAAETGTIGWYSPDHPVIDIVGLTTPRNATLLAHHDETTWLAEGKPDYVVIHVHGAFGEPAAVHSPLYERLPVAMSDVYLMKRK